MNLAPLATALRNAAAPAPRRFEVHRNTMMSGLVRAMADGFPSVERLVGPAFFAAMAADFVRAQPPAHPVLLAYGAGFATFIEGFAPVSDLPYLADVARLDGLRRRAWHAADARALDAGTLGCIDPDRLAGRRVALHPSVGVLGSPHPAFTLWDAQNGEDQGASGSVAWRRETCAVWRIDGAIHADLVAGELLALLDAARRRPALADLMAADNEAAAHDKARAFADALRLGLLVDADALLGLAGQAPEASLLDAFLPPFPSTPTTEAPR